MGVLLAGEYDGLSLLACFPRFWFFFQGGERAFYLKAVVT